MTQMNHRTIRHDTAAFKMPQEKWEDLMNAIRALSRADSTPAQPENSKWNSYVADRADPRPRTPSRYRDESEEQVRKNGEDIRVSSTIDNAPNESTISAFGSTRHNTTSCGSRARQGSSKLDPPHWNRYSGRNATYDTRAVISMPRPQSRVRCPPFLMEFSRLRTHSASVPRQRRYFPSHSPLPFHLTDGRDRSSRGFFLAIPSGTRDVTWKQYVRGFQGVY